MRQISSGTTFYNKRVSPVLFLGMSAVILIVALYQALTRGGEAIFFVIVVMLALACGCYFAKKNFFDLVDEVRDDGDALIVRNGGREERIALSDITNVSYSLFSNPRRVTLTIREAEGAGKQPKEISFCSPFTFNPFAKSPIIAELIDRIDAARLR